MNLFSLSQVVLHITGKVVDNAAAVAVLEEVAAVVKKEGSVDAFQLLRAEAAIRLVNVSRVSGKDEGKTAAKEIVEELVKFLKEREASTVHTDLRAQIYLAQAAVAKLEGSHDIFYEKCLLYIAHTQTSLLPHARQQEVAFDLGIAALLGKAVHNFGELIHHPIFAALDGSNHAWLAELLRYFNVGDIEGYEKVVAANGDNLKSFVCLFINEDPEKINCYRGVRNIVFLCVKFDRLFHGGPSDPLRGTPSASSLAIKQKLNIFVALKVIQREA